MLRLRSEPREQRRRILKKRCSVERSSKGRREEWCPFDNQLHAIAGLCQHMEDPSTDCLDNLCLCVLDIPQGFCQPQQGGSSWWTETNPVANSITFGVCDPDDELDPLSGNCVDPDEPCLLCDPNTSNNTSSW